MATTAGFEPAALSLEGSCSSTELRGQSAWDALEIYLEA